MFRLQKSSLEMSFRQNRPDKPPDLPQKGPKTPPKGAEHCNLRGIWLVEAVLYRNLQGFVVLAGSKKASPA